MENISKHKVLMKLSEEKGKAANNELRKTRIDLVTNIVENDIIDSDINNIKSLVAFFNKDENQTSRLDDFDNDLNLILNELNAWTQKQDNLKNEIKTNAISEMRKSKKKGNAIAIIVLSSVAIAALVLGVLSALEIISVVYCSLLGVLDFVAGVSFFVYELNDDRRKEREINNGNAEVITQYANPEIVAKKIKTTGDIINSGAGSVNITGKVKGNITIDGKTVKEQKEYISDLFKKEK